MSCCNGGRPIERKSVRLVFKRKEIVYDAENYSFVEGDIMATDNIHAQHQVFDIGQDGNIDRVTRVLNMCYAEVVEMLYPYTKSPIDEDISPIDDILKDPEEYVIDLSVPADFSMSTVKLLSHLIHEYLVYRVLSDWLSITNPNSSKNWEDKFSVLRMKIQTALVSRAGKIRRKLKPF